MKIVKLMLISCSVSLRLTKLKESVGRKALSNYNGERGYLERDLRAIASRSPQLLADLYLLNNAPLGISYYPPSSTVTSLSHKLLRASRCVDANSSAVLSCGRNRWA